MPDSKPKPEEAEEEGSVTEALSSPGKLVAEAAKGVPKAVGYGADTLSDIYQKLRKESGEVLSYNPQQDEHPHGFIQGGNISFREDPQDPNNPYKVRINSGNVTKDVRIGQEYKGPLTVRPKSDKRFAYEHGYEGKNIVEITDIPRGLDGKPTGIVVLDSDDELMFIPKESLGRLPNPEALLRRMKVEAQAEQAEQAQQVDSDGFPDYVDRSDFIEEYQDSFRATREELLESGLLDPLPTVDVDEMRERREVQEGDALGYAAEDGPYHGQDLTNEEVYEASAADFKAARDDPDGGEVETREYDGAVITEFGNGTFFMTTGEGVVNVTGHPGYDHTHPDYVEPRDATTSHGAFDSAASDEED